MPATDPAGKTRHDGALIRDALDLLVKQPPRAGFPHAVKYAQFFLYGWAFFAWVNSVRFVDLSTLFAMFSDLPASNSRTMPWSYILVPMLLGFFKGAALVTLEHFKKFCDNWFWTQARPVAVFCRWFGKMP